MVAAMLEEEHPDAPSLARAIIVALDEKRMSDTPRQGLGSPVQFERARQSCPPIMTMAVTQPRTPGTGYSGGRARKGHSFRASDSTHHAGAWRAFRGKSCRFGEAPDCPSDEHR